LLISEFDPWKNKFCTCPKKYSYSPYTGCSHSCIYCYITSYIPNAFKVRPKKNVFRRLEKELRIVDTYISMSNSSDPYVPEEKTYLLTRGSLEIFKRKNVKVLIITKSDLVIRDIDILKNMSASVSLTITTLDDEKAALVEPNAPPPSKRLAALKKLHENNIPCSVRLDPIIPGLNDDELEEIIDKVSRYCNHIVASTIKPRYDSLKRIGNVLPLDEQNFVKIGRSFYLPNKIRFNLLKRVERACHSNQVTFAACRENYSFSAPSCDGSHLIP
jgi:DNA repair photolyase